jgi:hypothetical protein
MSPGDTTRDENGTRVTEIYKATLSLNSNFPEAAYVGQQIPENKNSKSLIVLVFSFG